MHKLMAGSTILEHELSELRLLVERQTGLMLDCPNSALAAHVIEYLETHELESAAALLDRLRPADQDPAVLPHFLEGLLNANTGFFRHPTAMNALTRQVLPQLFARKSGEIPGTLRIWSAGCATGEEPYSIAMAISDALLAGSTNATANGNAINGNGNGKEKTAAARNGGIANVPSSASGQLGNQFSRDWSIHIVGSDLLPSAIETAERGLYPQSALAGLPPAIIRACFSKIASANAAQKLNGSNGNSLNGSGSKANGLNGTGLNGNGSNGNGSNGERSNGTSFPGSSKNDPGSDGATPSSHLLVKPRLRSMITFNVMNLVRAVYIGRFDCIFCMDVLPHLSRAQRTALVERLHLYLEPGGYLFLSQTEKLCAPNLNFRPETYDGYTFHRKPLAASAAYGR